MKRAQIAFGVLVLVLVASEALQAKGTTVLIQIASRGLSMPITVTSQSVEQFDIWTGPGTSGPSEGFVVEWKKGAVKDRPTGLPRYEVSFHVGCLTISPPACTAVQTVRAYAVSYEFDASSQRGFVYIPGKGDQSYEMNATSIYRGGYEGQWFLANDTWEKFIRPIIATAASQPAALPAN